MEDYFHDTIVIQLSNKDIYLIFNHFEKGDLVDIISNDGFPFSVDYLYTKLSRKLWFFWGYEKLVGGIVYQGHTIQVSPIYLLNIGLTWLYDINFLKPTKKFRGLVETITIMVLPKDSDNLPNLSKCLIFSENSIYPLKINHINSKLLHWNFPKKILNTCLDADINFLLI